MNYLHINNQYITTLQGLKECFLQEEARQLNSSLFDELKDYYRSGEIADFLCDIGEEDLADRIREIKSSESDTEMMQSLIAVITEEKVELDFDPMEYLEILETDILPNENGILAACLKVKITKVANEQVECVLKQGSKFSHSMISFTVGLDEIIPFEMQVESEGEEVLFMVDGKIIARENPNPMTDLTFNVKGMSFVMKPVNGGTFWMGAQRDDPCGRNYDFEAYYDAQPVHRVTVSSFYIGETQVTQALWKTVMGCNPSYWKGEDYPVESVSWNDCQAFINELNNLTKKQRGIKRFRLPTEAEWEFAARGGNKSSNYRFAGSNNQFSVAWFYFNSDGIPHGVKNKSCNELGLFDMSGNIREWCQDWYGDYSCDEETNPIGPASGSFRVIRGGSWSDGSPQCHVSSRFGWDPLDRKNDNGLRLVLR